jgi:tRNA nucleotidyltransferase (CCA-adding enzyme)
MIKLPKDINKMIHEIEKAGFEAYIVGGSLRDGLLGQTPKDWDIATNAPAEQLKQLFPDAEVISEKCNVFSVTMGELEAQVAPFRIDGQYSDYRRPDDVIFTDKAGEDLKRRDFTINAMMASPQRGIIDPFGGRQDLKARQIKTVGEPGKRFTEDPYRILRGIRFAAQLDFDIESATLQGMKDKVHLLAHISVDRIRDEFIKIITAKNSKKGLSLLIATGALPYILGEECVTGASKAERSDFTILTENIDRSKTDKEYRLGLIFICFKTEKAMRAIQKLHFDSDLEHKLQAAVLFLEELSFINHRVDLKQFIYKVGYETYQYLENLAKQQRKVYDFTEYKIRNRMTIFKDIEKNQEPIFLEDLAVSGHDLMELGLKGQEIGKMLGMLLDVVHKSPRENTKEALMKKAMGFQKNPIKALLRKVRWY